MKKRRIICLIVGLILTVTALSGCGGKNLSGEGKKEKVTIALWGNQMLENYAEYICNSFPDVDFEFVLTTNSTDYYRYRQKRNDMPDILSVRRFALKDAVCLKDYLYDLSNTELASTYYGTYLDNYTYDDGTINWLPACAEDNELNREIALELLKGYGFRIDTVKNGAEAVEKVATSMPGDYDVVLMDIQMPVMNGYEATRRIRSLENTELSEIPILAMTANAFDEDRRNAEECGMDGFLSKPIIMDEVIKALQQVL